MQNNIEQIYQDYGDIVLRRALSILGSKEEAQDILQEVFVSLVEKPDSFRGESKVSTFLYAATTHRCLRRLRDKKTRRRILDEKVKPFLSEEASDQHENQLVIRQALVNVPKKLVEPAIYYYMDGMKQHEIAEVMHCSRRQVGKLLDKFKATCAKKNMLDLSEVADA